MESTLEKLQEETTFFMSRLLECLNKEHSLSVKVKSKDELIPSCSAEHQFIFFNKHFLTLVALSQIRDFDLYYAFFLTYIYYYFFMYDEAEFWLEKAEEIINRLIENNINTQKYKKDLSSNIEYEQVIKYQISFVILHEFYHILFYKNKDYRENFFERLQKIFSDNDPPDKLMNLKSFSKEMEKIHLQYSSKCIKFLCKVFLFPLFLLYLFVNYFMIEYKKMYKDKRQLEEIGCDLEAFHKIIDILGCEEIPEKEQFELLVNVSKTLYYNVEIYSYLKNSLAWEISEIHMDKDTKKSKIKYKSQTDLRLLLSDIRYQLVMQLSADYLDNRKMGWGDSFKRQFSVFREKERLDLFKVIKIAQITTNLAGKKREYEDKDSLIENRFIPRMTALEQSIYYLAKSNWEQNCLEI